MQAGYSPMMKWTASNGLVEEEWHKRGLSIDDGLDAWRPSTGHLSLLMP
jgi:hypothetical protein